MPISRTDAAHLLRRAGFGATKPAIDLLSQAASWGAAVDVVCDTSRDPAMLAPATLLDTSASQFRRLSALDNWWMERMRSGPCPLVDKIALFHHGLWTTRLPWEITMLWDALIVYRRKSLGSYRDFAQAMAVTPTMLTWLNNDDNVAPDRFNENFARELMELFTMGNGTYSQADVRAMTRAWSGHGSDATGLRYQFRADHHDAGLKTLFGITKAWNGPDTIDEILLGSKAVVSSEYYVSRLWSFLAYPNPEPALVADLATQFRADGLHVGRLVKRVFLRPEFRSQKARYGLLRSPTEFMVAVAMALDIPISAAKPMTYAEYMGQMLFVPPNVSGWSPRSWLSDAGFWRRGHYLTDLSGLATTAPYNRFAGLEHYAPWAMFLTAVRTFGIESCSAATQGRIMAWATGMKGTPQAWSIPRSLVVLMGMSPEFQLA